MPLDSSALALFVTLVVRIRVVSFLSLLTLSTLPLGCRLIPVSFRCCTVSQYSSHVMSPDSSDSDKTTKSVCDFSNSVTENFRWGNSCHIPDSSRGPFILLPLPVVSGSFSVSFVVSLWQSCDQSAHGYIFCVALLTCIL